MFNLNSLHQKYSLFIFRPGQVFDLFGLMIGQYFSLLNAKISGGKRNWNPVVALKDDGQVMLRYFTG